MKTGEKQADLVICVTAAHFMDPDVLAASIAKTLRPGGTLAVSSYWMPTFPDQSHHFHDVFATTLESLVLKLVLSGNGSGRAMLARVLERRMTGKGALNPLPLPEDLYDDTLRVYINSGTDEIPYRAMSRQFAPTKS